MDKLRGKAVLGQRAGAVVLLRGRERTTGQQPNVPGRSPTQRLLHLAQAVLVGGGVGISPQHARRGSGCRRPAGCAQRRCRHDQLVPGTASCRPLSSERAPPASPAQPLAAFVRNPPLILITWPCARCTNMHYSTTLSYAQGAWERHGGGQRAAARRGCPSQRAGWPLGRRSQPDSRADGRRSCIRLVSRHGLHRW
eukprot:COSAG01_NODE_45_length_32100_cov_28.037218_8_plen_196_part_00